MMNQRIAHFLIPHFCLDTENIVDYSYGISGI